MSALGGKLPLRRLLFSRGEGKGSLLAEVPEGNADRAQGLGHRLRKSQAQSLPRHTIEMSALSGKLPLAFGPFERTKSV